MFFFSPMFPILLHMFKYLLKRFLCSNLQGWQPAPLNGLRRVYNVITSDLSFAPLVTPLKLPSLDSPTLLNFYMLDFSELSPGDILYFFFTVKSFLRPYRLFCSFEDPGIWQQLKHFFLGSISFPWNPDSHKPWLSKHSQLELGNASQFWSFWQRIFKLLLSKFPLLTSDSVVSHTTPQLLKQMCCRIWCISASKWSLDSSLCTPFFHT